MESSISQKELFFNNLLILGLDKAAIEKEYRVNCDKEMFSLPNQRMFEIVSYFLFGKLNGVTGQEYFLPWPVLDKDQRRQFQKACANYLSNIAQESNIKFPRIVPSLLSTFGGDRFYELYLALSTHVVEKTIRKNNNVSLLLRPMPSQQNQQDVVDTLKTATILSVEKFKEIQHFSYKNFELLLKTANNFISHTQKLKSSLASNLSLLEKKSESLVSLFSGDADLNENSPLKSMTKIAEYEKKVTKLWKQLDLFLKKEKKLWSYLCSAVQENPQTFVLDGARLKFNVHDAIREHCPELNEICSIKAKGEEKVCLLKYLEMYRIFMEFYTKKLLKGDLLEIQEVLSSENALGFQSSLDDLKSLNEKLSVDVMPNIKESNKKLQENLFSEEFSDDLQTFSKECSSWSFSSKTFQKKVTNSRLAFSNNLTDEVLRSSLLFGDSLAQDDTFENGDDTLCYNQCGASSDLQNTVFGESISLSVGFCESNAPSWKITDVCDDYNLKQDKSNRHSTHKEEFLLNSNPILDLIPFSPIKNNPVETTSTSSLPGNSELAFDIDFDYRRPFKMRESWLLEESLNSLTLPETSFLD